MSSNFKFKKCRVVLRSLRFLCFLILYFSWINFVNTIEPKSTFYPIGRTRRFRLRGVHTRSTRFPTTYNTTVSIYSATSPPSLYQFTNIVPSAYGTTTEQQLNENLRNHIKNVLNIEQHNNTLDKYIANSFNLHNPDPLYVFILPDELNGNSNQTLVLRRSNFTEAIFPNITTIKMLQQLSHASHMLAKQNDYYSKNNKLWKNEEIPKKKFDQFKNSAYDLDEAASLRIVEENVRTERNFVQFMEDLNHENEIAEESKKVSVRLNDGRSLNEYEVILKQIHAKTEGNKSSQLLLTGETMTGNKRLRKPLPPIHPPVSWGEMGLAGWAGSLKPIYTIPIAPGKSAPEELLTNPNNHLVPNPKKFIPILATFDSLSFLTTTRSTPTVPEIPIFDQQDKIPSHVKSYAFVRLYKQNHVPTTVSAWPGTTPHSHSHPHPPTTTSAPVTLFSPADTYLNSGEYFHEDKTKWDYSMYMPEGLRELLKAERDKLRNISLTIGYDYKAHRKWPLTSSRSAHRDGDVFIGRANDPFGHSTRWKWNTTKHNEVDGRHKRGVVELYSMVKCATGCDPLIYKGYGCYCGFLGSGRAIDGIDRCCKMHDYCYASSNCPKFLEYFVPYLWKCYRGRPLCAIDHGEWGGRGSCASTLCECDQALSKCLRRYYCPRKRAVCTSSPARLLQNLIMGL